MRAWRENGASDSSLRERLLEDFWLERVAIALVVALHVADEGLLIVCGKTGFIIFQPRFKVFVKGVKVPAAIMRSKMGQSGVCNVASSLACR
jgi:hypothetical protein